MTEQKRDVRLGIRLTHADAERLRAMASVEHRTVSAQVRHWIAEAWRAATEQAKEEQQAWVLRAAAAREGEQH